MTTILKKESAYIDDFVENGKTKRKVSFSEETKIHYRLDLEQCNG